MYSSYLIYSPHPGLLFFIMKHCVDKYNLTWVYTPSKIKNNDQIHRLAIQLFIFSVVMLQLFQTGVSYLRNLDTNQGDIARLSLVQHLLYCALIGRELHSDEISSD